MKGKPGGSKKFGPLLGGTGLTVHVGRFLINVYKWERENPSAFECINYCSLLTDNCLLFFFFFVWVRYYKRRVPPTKWLGMIQTATSTSFRRLVPDFEPVWIAVCGAGCYYMVCSLLLRATLADRCWSHTPFVHC